MVCSFFFFLLFFLFFWGGSFFLSFLFFFYCLQEVQIVCQGGALYIQHSSLISNKDYAKLCHRQQEPRYFFFVFQGLCKQHLKSWAFLVHTCWPLLGLGVWGWMVGERAIVQLCVCTVWSVIMIIIEICDAPKPGNTAALGAYNSKSFTSWNQSTHAHRHMLR